MNYKQLKEYNNRVTNLKKALEPVFKHWDDPMTKVIDVLLQNLQFSTTLHHDSELMEALPKIQLIENAIFSLCDYHEYHLTKFIKQELNMISMML